MLVLHAERSLRAKKWSDDLLRADIVLDVGVARLAPVLGPNAEVDAVPDGIHDLALAPPDGPRETAFRIVTDWLARVRQD